MKYPRYQRGAFTAQVGKTALIWTRDDVGLELLSDQSVNLAFLGDDKLKEWELNGRLADYSVIDTIPLDCTMVLAGPRQRVDSIPTQLGVRSLLTVATSYPELLKEFAKKLGLNLVATQTPSGGCEAFPRSDRTDLCFDIKDSGRTLVANDLIVYRESKPLSLNVLDAARFNKQPQADNLSQSLEKIAQKLNRRYRTLQQDPEASSYTIELFRDSNKRVKKLGEESAELLQALLRQPANKQEITSEAADFLCVLEVWLTCNGLNILDVLKEDISRNNQDEL